MKNKWYKVFIILVLALSIFIVSADTVRAENGDMEQKVYTYGDFQYQYMNDTDYVAIVGYTGKDEVVTYPGEIVGKKVYSICCYSTYSSEEVLMVKEVVIPYGVKEIFRMGSFKNLEKVQLPESLEVIGAYAFEDCKKLEFIHVPEGLKKIGIAAFYQCESLKEVVIPKGVSVIEELAFAGCTGLRKITFSPGLKKIGVEAFTGCTSLKEIVIPDTVVKIDDGAFWGCEKLTKVKLSKNLTTIHEDSFTECNIKSIEIPKKVKKIEEGAFMENSFTSITIPSKVTYIGKHAFRNCKKLKKVTIKGTKLKQIKKWAFTNINKKATFDVPNKHITKYKQMLIKAESFKEGKMKIK